MVSREALAAEVRGEVARELANRLVQLAGGDLGGVEPPAAATPDSAPPATPLTPGEARVAGSEYMAPWLDTDQCTACGECIEINPTMFAYNERKKAYIQNPGGGPYRDLVRAAERCTARIIHPGLPKDRSARDVEKWIARGRRFN